MASSKKPILAAVAADTLIAVVEFVGGAITGSVVMVAEGIHSLLDAGSASLLLLGERLGTRPATRRHPFGHGKEVYFWATVVAMLAFVMGGGFAALEGVLAFREHEHHRLWINFVVLAASFLFNGGSLIVAVRELRRYQREKRYGDGLFDVVRDSHNPGMWVTVLADLAAVVGVVIAVIGVALSALLHSSVPDAVTSIADGVLMMVVGIFLGLEARSLVVGEGARKSLVDDARRILANDAHIAAVTELRSLQLGPDDVLLVVTARFARELRVGELPELRRELHARLHREHPSIRELVFAF